MGNHKDKKGVVYVAFGSIFVAKALYSACSVRYYNPGISIEIITNIPFPGAAAMGRAVSIFDKWNYINEDSGKNRIYKTNIVNYIDLDKAIYIDCDTFVTGSLDLAWFFLDYFDVALRFQEGRQKHPHLAKYEIFKDIATPMLPHWNGGVLMFRRNTSVINFFDLWLKYFLESGLGFDQPTLVKALFESNVRVLSLDARWNGGFQPLKTDGGRISKIIHYHSMYDYKISRELIHYHNILEESGSAPENLMKHHIRERNKMRLRNEPIRFLLRRIYRRLWYIRNLRGER